MSGEPAEIDAFLRRLTRFFLRNSAEGAFDVRDVVRRVGACFGVRADVLLIAEAAVVTVAHPDGPESVVTVRAVPQLARLDRVAQSKNLVTAITSGRLTLAEADRALTTLESSRAPFPDWLKVIGVALFAVGFAPSVQATWREVGSSALLGLVMGLLFLLAGRFRRMDLVLPIIGPIAVGVVAFGLLDAANAPGGPVLVMIPALFVLIPGDYLCAAAAELAVGQFTPGAVRLAQAVFILVELAVGLIIAAEITQAGAASLSERTVPDSLPFWIVVASWIPFTIGLVLTFTARPRDFLWMLLLVYLAWGTQLVATALTDHIAGTFVAGVVLSAAVGLLEWSENTPPRIVLILGGFFALTVGAVALRGLTTLEGGQTGEALSDLVAAVMQATALTLGLVVGTIATLVKPARMRPTPARAPTAS
ncbi:threonine/serine exporter family protein [Hamadaea sp. NPDC050747]|uniref:threonine/serine ThrE exporter family protein n=1 Tax=Hamadaea sp. NPDC050747 TaxID=3155789 RepID=UPI003410FD07